MIIQLALTFLTVLLILLAFLWLYFESPVRRQKQLLARVPGPKIYPIIGNLLELGQNENLRYFTKQGQKYGNIFKLQLVRRISVICSNPVDIENMLRHTNNNNKPTFVSNLLGSWIGQGLVLSSGSHWRAMRKALTPSFDYNMLKRFFVVFDQQTDVLIKSLRSKTSEIENVDIFPLLQLFALDVICETAMGTRMEAQTKLLGNDYTKAVQQMEYILLQKSRKLLQSIPLIAPLTSLGRQHQQCLKIIKTTIDKIIRERRQKILKNENEEVNKGEGADDGTSGERMVFLDFLLTCQQSCGVPLTDQQIYDEVSTFMAAGHDSTATQMSFLLFLLSRNPGVQHEIYKEQMEILGEEDGKFRDYSPTFEDIQRMNYLERAIKESQRLYPTFPIYSREVTNDFKLSNGVVLPKNVTFSVFLMQLHRDPDIYPNPDQFVPDRFLPENVRSRSSGAFVPFGMGPRTCIGQKFAVLEMKTCVSKLVRNFKILPAYDENGALFEPQLMMTILLASQNGIQIRLKPRK